MLQIDASKGWGELLRIAITGAIITRKSIHLDHICESYNPPGLTRSKIRLLETLQELKLVTIKGLGVGSTTLIIEPLEKDLPRKIDIDLERPASAILALNAIILPLLFSKHKHVVTIKGATNSLKAPPATTFREILMKYYSLYTLIAQCNITTLGCYPEIGEVQVTIQGKGELHKAVSPLRIRINQELVALRGELITADETYADRTRRLLELSFSSLQQPFTLDTRTTKTPSTALTLMAYYGDEYGYDSTKPFVKGLDMFKDGEIKESELLEFAKRFREETHRETLDQRTAEQLVPLLAIVGGELPIETLEGHIEAAIPILEQIYEVQFNYANKRLICNGYVSQIEEEIIALEDL